jgi:hypothetical protein
VLLLAVCVELRLVDVVTEAVLVDLQAMAHEREVVDDLGVARRGCRHVGDVGAPGL